MKKEKKAKKIEQNENGILRKKWPVWKTIVSVISSVFGLVGVTVLGVYLAGGFEEKIVNPESIVYSYNSDIYNTENEQIEVTEDFELLITSPTEKTTENTVTLSFLGNTPVTRDNGYISNGIIQVPEVVEIGTPFTVKLETEILKDENGENILDENNNIVNWIKGGICVINAKSEYNQISSKQIQVAVDVPVYKTIVEVYNSNGDKTNQVITNESFSLKTKFIPAKSEYMFSDDSNDAISEENKRVKSSFYEAENAGNKISPFYDSKYDMHFVAGNETVDEIVINSYTFNNSKAQLEYESTLGEIADANFYNAMFVYLSNYSEINSSSSCVVSIGEASIGNFTVSSQNLSAVKEQTTRVYMSKNNSVVDSKFFGVNVYSTSGILLEGMLQNIAISFDKDGIDPTQGEDKTITIQGGDCVELNGVFYYKANKNVSNYNYAYWDITSTISQDVTIKIVLIVNTEDGVDLFKISEEPQIKYVDFSISEHQESSLSWGNQADISVMLDYNTDGTIAPQEIDLSSLPQIPENNIYKDVVFFAYFGEGTKDELKATVDSVIGSTGYNYDASGTYATDTDNLVMFAIVGDKITLYNTGTFKLYYATYKGMTSEGLYDIVLMCSGSVNVICEKSLYSDSVNNLEIDTNNFQEIDEEVVIDQGSDLSFGVKFFVTPESVPVFEDEYKKDFMSLVISDKSHNDITSIFIIDNHTFTIDEETNQGVLEYRLKVNEASAINDVNGVNIGYAELKYNDQVSKNITWEFVVINNICIYDPQSVLTYINSIGSYKYGNIITGQETINVVQSLQQDGSFKVEITLKNITGVEEDFSDFESLLNALLGEGKTYVIVVDQKTRTDTLSGQWKFAVKSGDSSIINISADGQSFSFREATNINIELYIQSNDGLTSSIDNADNNQYIKFNVNSTGVTGMRTDISTSTYETILSTEISSDVSFANVTKYGSKGNDEQFIVLSNLIEFFIGDTATGKTYTNFQFTFKTQYITSGSTLSDTMVTDLFGQNGMLTLYTYDASKNAVRLINFNDDYSVQNIRDTLISTTIYQIKINKNFAVNHTLEFTISDKSGGGAVNTEFYLNLTSNISVSSVETYNDYAHKEILINNKVSNYNLEQSELNFSSLYKDNKDYSVVYENSKYILKESLSDDDEVVAIYNSGKIIFEDFWDVESKYFTISFQPEGDNYFALNKPISFEILRDLKIVAQDGVFCVLGDSSYDLENFVRISRFTEEEGDLNVYPTGLEFVFEKYLKYEEGKVQKSGEEFFFDYNQTELKTNLYIKLQDTTNEDALAIIPVTIKLTDVDDLYALLANALKLQSDRKINATTQIVDDVEYIVINRDNSDPTWIFENLQSYIITPSGQDYYGNSINNYIISGASKRPPILLNKQGKLLSGLNDDSVYLVLEFYSNEADTKPQATMHVPLIISSIGYDFVKYESKVENNKSLEKALTTPEKLYKEGIYNEITAGQLTEIIFEKEFSSPATTGGLYTINGLNQKLEFYPIDSSIVNNTKDLIKNIYIDKDENNISYGNITLNHLASNAGNYFIALEYTILNTDDLQQTFYYLLKVVPDITVNEPLYAYDGESEHLIAELGVQNSKNLEELYNDTTLHSNYKRFNVTKNLKLNYEEFTTGENKSYKLITPLLINVNSEKVTILISYNGNSVTKVFKENTIYDLSSDFISLSYEYNDLTSVENIIINIIIMDGDGNIYYGLDYEKYLSDLRSEDAQATIDSLLNNKNICDSFVFGTLKYVNEIESVVVNGETFYEGNWSGYIDLSFSSNYSTFYYEVKPQVNSSITVNIKHTYKGGLESDEFSIIGAEQKYVFVINDDTTKYTIRFKEGTSEQITDNYIWELSNIASATEKTKTLNVDLIANSTGSSQTGTVVRNKVDIKLTSGSVNITNDNGDITSYGDIASYSYNSANGEFKITLNDYLDSDRELEFAVFTEQGFLATLTVKVSSNASYKFIGKNNNLNAGTDYSFGDLFSIYLDKDENNDYTISSVTFDSDGKDFVKFNSNSIQIADLIDNKTLNATFEITFNNNNNKTFEFSYNFNLIANLTRNTNVKSNINTIAGNSHTIDNESLYTGTLSNYTTIKLEARSSSPAYEGLEFDATNKQYKIKTTYVSANITLEIELTVKLYTDFKEDVYQSYTLLYSFDVYPSVQISTNYPKPNSNYTDQIEFIEDGSKFSEVLTNFFSSPAIFAQKVDTQDQGTTTYKKRVEVLSASIDNNDVVYENPALIDTRYLTITLSKIQNASVMKNESTSVSISGALGSSDSISFHRGTYKDNEYNDNGSDSIIELTFTYQEVSVTYTIYVVKNVLTLSINRVTNNIGVEGATQYEKIYVDKTSLENLYAEERMASVDMSPSMQNYANQYYLVFKDSNSYYASYPIYFFATDQGKTLTIDLGISMAGKEFVGAYLTSYIENSSLSILNNEIKAGDKAITDILNTSNNMTSKLFKGGAESIKLINRIQLVYGNNILVDYNRYSANLSESSINSGNLDETKWIYVINDSFNKNDGSENSTVTFSLQYYYKLLLDIDVDAKASSSANYTELLVNYEYPSAVEKFGIRHPSNGQLLTSSEFTNEGTTLTREILELSSSKLSGLDGELRNVINNYFTKYNFSEFSNEIDGNEYLTFSNKEISFGTNNKNTYDFQILALGAKNEGNFQLVKFTYSKIGFSKNFYVVVLIKPDYIVKYGGSEANATDEGEYVSNISKKYSISTTIDGTTYTTINLLGNDSSYLSIKHRYGDNTSVERSSSFDLKLEIGLYVDSVEYNNETNVENKLNLGNNGWSISDRKYTKEAQNGVVELEDVNIVVFGTQYYMIEGEDNYGYKFKLYFCLEPPEGYTPPSVKGDVIQLKELQYFDIGATYKLLEIQKESSSTQESTNLYITGEDTSPTSVGDVEMIELQGIKAWAFKYDYTDEESEHKYLSNKVSSSNSPDGYDLDNSDYTMSSSDREYLDLDELMLDNISVESVSFYDLNNSQKAICEIEPTSTNTLTSGEEGQTTSSTVYRLATARAGTEAFYNPQDFLRGGYSSPDVTSGEEETPEFEPFQVPRFENTDIFKGGNKASLSMAIRLKYVNSNNKEEYFDCTVKVEITREISIDSSYKVVKDDEGFNVSNLITVSVNGIEKTEDVTYLSDTLEMKIPANSSTSFEMILKRGDEEIARTSFSQGNTGVSYNKTYFISLSEKFGVNVKEGDKVEIIKTNSSDSTEFIYNGSSGVQEFTIDKTMSDTLEMRIPANTSTSFEMILSPTNGEIVRTSFSLENTDESDKIYEISLSEKFGVNVQEGDKVEIIKTNKFIYNGSSGAEFTISVITQDKVCIDDASQLDPNMYYPVTKYYIVNVKIGLITYSYQADGNMYVTGKFFKLVKDYSTEIAYVLQKTENSTSTENSISNWFSKSSSYPIYLVGAEIDTDGNIVANNDKMSPDPDTNQYLKYLKFSIDTSDGGSGKATIDEEGTITIQNDFSSDEYIKVLVQMKVSGGSYINIGYIRLGLTKTSGTT